MMRPRPDRHWGQHFLNDQTVIESIIAFADITLNEVVLEIGPGPGVLTDALLAAGAQVIAIERDPRFEVPLHQSFDATDRFTLVRGDAIRVDWVDSGLIDKQFRVIANIPYSITTPLLEKFLTSPAPTQAILMIQDDVARRLLAGPASSDRGALSVIMQESFSIKIIRTVPSSAFTPPPKVQSAVVMFLPKYRVPVEFGQFLKNCFRHRRKFLLSNLKIAYQAADWPSIFTKEHIQSTVRPQDLSNEQWRSLFFCLESTRRTNSVRARTV